MKQSDKRMQDSFRNNNAGMTLVEVIVALSVLLMVMAGSYTLIVQTAALTRAARYQYLASTIGKSRLERAQTFPYEDLHHFEEDQVLVDGNGSPSENGTFRRSTIVDTNAANNCTEIEVIVEIQNPKTGQFEGWTEEIATKFTFLPEDDEE
jgi:prepilin-type N-terminal cleavage/methylation domain-containing protein